MRFARYALGFVVAFAWLGGTAGGGGAESALAAIGSEYVEAFNAGDIPRVLALYDERATLVSESGTFAGHDGIARWLETGTSVKSRLEPLIVEASAESDGLAYESGRTRRHVGAELHLGQYLVVVQKSSRGWKIVRHFSVTTR